MAASPPPPFPHRCTCMRRTDNREQFAAKLVRIVAPVKRGRPVVVIGMELDDVGVVASMLVDSLFKFVSGCLRPFSYFRNLGLLVTDDR